MTWNLPRNEALLAGVALVLPGLLWAWLDHRPWPWDQAHYAEMTLRTLAAFREGVISGVASMGVLMSLKPPGLTWLGAPFALLADLFGRIEPALLCATLVWQAGTLIACYASAWLLTGSRMTALAVAAFIGSTPIFIGMNHQYLVEPLQTFAVSLAFLLALCARDMSKVALFCALATVAALAMAAKSTSLLYCGLPLLFAAYALLRSEIAPASWIRRAGIPLVLLSLFGVALTVNWYAGHFAEMFEHARQSTVGAVVDNYGVRAGFASKASYWISALAAALAFPSWLPLLAAATGAFIPRREGTAPAAALPPRQGTPSRLVVAAAAVHLVAGLVAYSLQVNEDVRFLEPFLPASAMVMAALCNRLRRFAAPRTLLAAALMQFVLGYGYALGVWPAASNHQWLLAVERDDTRRAQLRAMVDATCDRDRPFDVNLVGVQYSWLSAASANFYAVWAQDGKPICRYAALDNGDMKSRLVLQRLDSFMHRYYISVVPARMPPQDFVNRVSAEAFARVAASPDWERVRTIDDTIVVFRSTRF